MKSACVGTGLSPREEHEEGVMGAPSCYVRTFIIWLVPRPGT